MKHTLKKLSDTSVSVAVVVDPDTIKKAKELAVRELGKTVKVQGFRAGKVPAAVVEKNIDPNTLGSETVEYAVNAALNDVIIKEDLRVLDQPKIDLKKFVPFDTLEFTAEIEILPVIKLGNYKTLNAKKESTSVEKAEVDDVIERMRQGFSEKSPVKRAAKNGDEVVIDFEGRDKDGALIEGAKGDDYPLVLGSSSFIPGFEQQIVGHKIGENFDIEVTFPKDYHADHLKNAKVKFSISIKSINEIKLPAVDDEFAKKAGPFNTAKDLKADIKNELTAQKERSAVEKLKDDLLGQLVEASEVPMPKQLVHDQMHALENDMMQNLMYRGQSLDSYLKSNGYKDNDEWKEKELLPLAERRVKAGLVIAELSKAEKIEFTKDDLEAELTKRKEEAPKIADQLDTPEARRDLANRLITEKTIDKLVELNS